MNDSKFHRAPVGNAMTAAEQHAAMNDPLHTHCTYDTCELWRYCWLNLRALGHAHPQESPERCPQCRADARTSMTSRPA